MPSRRQWDRMKRETYLKELLREVHQTADESKGVARIQAFKEARRVRADLDALRLELAAADPTEDLSGAELLQAVEEELREWSVDFLELAVREWAARCRVDVAVVVKAVQAAAR